MRLYYLDEREGESYFIRSALGVDAGAWNEVFQRVRSWRGELRERFGIPHSVELQPLALLGPGAGGGSRVSLSAEQRVAVFESGLRLIEDAARFAGGIEVINVCLPRHESGRHEEVSLGRLLTRINTSARAADTHAFLIFDEVREESITRLYRRLRVHNPIPSRYDAWRDGSPTRNIPLDRIIGGPAFRSAGDDQVLQLAGFVAHALLLQEEPADAAEGGLTRSFTILNHVVNREASQRDTQGVVRR